MRSEGKEQQISKILVAIDGSENSLRAADYAIEIAYKYNAEIIALNVIVSDMTLLGPTIPPHILELKQEAQNYLNKVKEKIENSIDSNDEHKVLLRTELIGSHSAVDGIAAFAEKDNIDLIIVGTRGRSGFERLLLGSVASGVVLNAHCPVMIVK